MSFFNKILKSFLGDKNQRDLKEVGKIVAKIKKVEPVIRELSDDELRGKSREFKEKINSGYNYSNRADKRTNKNHCQY